MIFVKYAALALAIVYTFSNFAKFVRGHRISSYQCWFMAIGIAVYVMLEFELGF